jgi:hypothetical protein
MSEQATKIDPGVARWRIGAATLAVAQSRLEALDHFYRDQLGLVGTCNERRLQLSVARAELTFDATSDGREPFYHFALLVPGNRFAAAHDWLAACAPPLARPESGETRFGFDFWNADACYVHDPAGNIVELIAHRGIEESGAEGQFGVEEIRGISELGIVSTDLLAGLQRLRASGLELWFGEVGGERDGFGFVGRQAHTLILCPPGRPWLPTGRPAEAHPLDARIMAGESDVVVHLRDAVVEVDSRQASATGESTA